MRNHKKTKVGTITAFYLMWYSFGRFFIEGSRTDSLMIFGLKAAQIVSILLFIIGLIIMMINSRKSAFDDNYSETTFDEVRF